MVVDFPVESDCGLVVVGYEWLIATRQIDDLQPHRAKRRFGSLENPVLVGPSMIQQFGQACGHTLVHTALKVCKPRDATHCLEIPERSEERRVGKEDRSRRAPTADKKKEQ